MKRSIAVLCLLGLCLAALTGCFANAAAPVNGMLFMDVKGPVAATSHTTSTRMGSAKATTILGLIATGDASIEQAMRNGNITRIHHVDHKSENILGIMASFTTIVHGE